LVGAAAVATTLGLLVPTAGIAAEPGNHNGTGSVKSPPTTGAAAEGTSARHTITFDTGTSPCTFDLTGPLREDYADQGVHFTGPSEDSGGAILNQCGSFGVDARSGEEFLAFATGTYAVPPERIRFEDLQRKITVFVANGFGDGTSTFRLAGRRDGEVVARKSVTTEELGWVRISVAASSGIDELTLTGTTPDGGFVVDDLKFRDL
jgi:hypothetical protein